MDTTIPQLFDSVKRTCFKNRLLSVLGRHLSGAKAHLNPAILATKQELT